MRFGVVWLFGVAFGVAFWCGFWCGFLSMDTGGPKRKKRWILKEHEWELTFVRTYFGREDKAVTAKSTYDVLLSEIRKQYPDFDLHKNAFKTRWTVTSSWTD